MKKWKQSVCMLLVLTLMLTLSACGGTTAEPEKPAKEITAARPALRAVNIAAFVPAELPAEGEYELFAVEYDSALVYAADLELASTLTLTADGKGLMTFEDETMDITRWTAEAEAFTLLMADGGSADGKLKNGVIELDLYGNGEMILFYAQEGADLSGYAPLTMEEYRARPDSMLYAFWSSLDMNAGVHLNYNMQTDYMDADQDYDVHGKNGVFYSRRTNRVSGFENTMVTFFRDGTAYNLYPDDMTGVIVTTTTSSYITDSIMLMDPLYSDIHNYMLREDYTTQTQDIEGVTYTVELFPPTDSIAEAAFYFRDDGRLVYCLKGIPPVETGVEIGETVYTVYTVDDAVDETLFDISGYAIR